jgi:N-acetylmuramoyl-L-alanine amidase
VPDWQAEEVGMAKPEMSTVAVPTLTINDVPASEPGQAPNPFVRSSVSSNERQPGVGQPHDRWLAMDRWCREAGMKAPAQLSGELNFELKGTNGTLVLAPWNHSVLWQGVEFRLGFAPTLIDNQVFVHALDLRNTLEPLLFGERVGVRATIPVIVIDPGHGGENAGTRSAVSGHYEKELTLDWSKRLATLLEGRGWKVYLTRDGDRNLALSNRVAFADTHKADVFISLHFNSAGDNDREAGLETYCLTPAGLPSSITRDFADEVDVSFPNNRFDRQNLLLAFAVHDSLLKTTGERDRGVRRARFPGVLRNQFRPAILVEGGYLSSPAEASKIEAPEYRQKLAEGVAAGLAKLWKQASELAPLTKQEDQFGKSVTRAKYDSPAPSGSTSAERLPENGLGRKDG